MPYLHSPIIDNAASEIHSAAQQQRILVYDDDEACALGFCTILRRAGYEVEAANHFDPALRTFEQRCVDLLLADLVVPNGVNGLALARMARMKQQKIKIIYVTGYDVPAAKESGLGPILRKPVSDELLLSEVRKALNDAAAN